MMNFAEHFWGDKNNGFDVLYHNMKLGHVASQDLIAYLKESCQVEENYSKSLTKLALKANHANQNGSFAPVWQIIRAFPEKLASVHLQMVHQMQDQVKELCKYSEELHTKHKSVKETESTTEECVRNMKSTLVSVQKAKDNYKARIIELEKLKKENTSAKELDKCEARFKKATEEYKMYVEKYAIVREDFNRKMVESSTRFQELEETHLKRLREFVCNYSLMWEVGHVAIGEVTAELKSHLKDMTCDRLLTHFIEVRSTGSDRPGPIEFETADDILNGHASGPGTPDADSIGSGFGEEEFKSGTREGSSGGSGGKGGLGGRDSTSGVAGSLADLDGSQGGSVNNVSAAVSEPPPPVKTSAFPKLSLPGPGKLFTKKKKKKTRKKKKGEEESDDDVAENMEAKPQVDAEGFSIPPEFTPAKKEDDDSSSFSDSDDDEVGIGRKGFNVVIRPLEDSPGLNGVSGGEGGGSRSGGGSSADASLAALVSSVSSIRLLNSKSPSQITVQNRSQSQAGPTDVDSTWGNSAGANDAKWDDKIKRTHSQSSSDSVRPRSTSFTLHNPPSRDAAASGSAASGLEAPPSRRAASVTPQQSLQKQRYQEAEKSAPVAVEDWQEDFEREWQVMAGPRTDNTWNVDSAWQSSSLSLDQIEDRSARSKVEVETEEAELVSGHDSDAEVWFDAECENLVTGNETFSSDFKMGSTDYLFK